MNECTRMHEGQGCMYEEGEEGKREEKETKFKCRKCSQ